MTSGKLRINPEAVWDNYLAYLELRKCPKFDASPSKSVLKKPPTPPPPVAIAAAANENDEASVSSNVSDGLLIDQY
jgi:hypothetical protein